MMDETNNGTGAVEGCVALGYPRTIYSKDQWAVFQRAYNAVRPRDAGTPGTDGFLIDYEVVDHPERGRTIVTREDLPKGTHIWSEEEWHVSFGEEGEFLRFLELLPSPAHRCEILLWAYVSHGKATVELDAGSFFNHHDDPKMRNVGPTTTKQHVKAGTELLMDYSFFIQYNELPWLDTLRSNAWKDPAKDDVAVYQHTTGYNQLGAPAKVNPRLRAKVDPAERSSLHRNSVMPVYVTSTAAVLFLFYKKILKKAAYKTG